MPQIQSFKIPPTRLSFLDSEIAVLKRGGETWLATSFWGGPGNGRILLIDPQNGDQEERPLPEKESGAAVLKTGPDGRLYLAGYAGNLFRFDPNTDEVETLVKGQLSGPAWGGCVTERYVVWTAGPGQAAVYDWWRDDLAQLFKPLESGPPGPWQGSSVVECPDGRVLIGLNRPQAKWILLDPASGARQVLAPEELSSRAWMRDAAFLDSNTLAFLNGAEVLIFDYPGFMLVGRASLPESSAAQGVRGVACGGRYYVLSNPGGSLYRLNAGRCGWELERRACIATAPAVLGAIAKGLLAAINADGTFFRLDLSGGPVFSCDLPAWGPLEVQAFRPVPELQKAFGASAGNLRFWQADFSTRTSRDLGRAMPGGESAGMVWDIGTRRLLLTSGPGGWVTAYDPARPVHWPVNPKVMALLEDAPGLPLAFIHDGRFAWLISRPGDGTRSGTLTRLDPRDGSARTWKELLPGRTPTSLVADPAHHRLFLSMEETGGDEAKPGSGAVRMLAFDTKNLSILKECAPPEPAGALTLLAMLGPGRVLGLSAERLFAWETETGMCEDLGKTPQGLREVAAAPNGMLYTCAVRHIARLKVGKGTAALEPLAPGAGRYLAVVGTHLWYVEGQEVRALSLA